MTYTWKIIYTPIKSTFGRRGVALVEAATKAEASWTFQQLYAGQYFVIYSIEKLG